MSLTGFDNWTSVTYDDFNTYRLKHYLPPDALYSVPPVTRSPPPGAITDSVSQSKVQSRRDEASNVCVDHTVHESDSTLRYDTGKSGDDLRSGTDNDDGYMDSGDDDDVDDVDVELNNYERDEVHLITSQSPVGVESIAKDPKSPISDINAKVDDGFLSVVEDDKSTDKFPSVMILCSKRPNFWTEGPMTRGLFLKWTIEQRMLSLWILMIHRLV